MEERLFKDIKFSTSCENPARTFPNWKKVLKYTRESDEMNVMKNK